MHSLLVGTGSAAPSCSRLCIAQNNRKFVSFPAPQAAFCTLKMASRTARSVIRQRATVLPRAAATMTAASVSERMAELKKQGKVAFIPYLCAGDGGLETTKKALIALCEEGADVIELGIPYSDPLADGSTIQAAATRALDAGTTVDKVLNMLKDVSPQLTAPVVVFCYYNPVLRRGFDKFCRQVKEAGAAGLLVPDIPLEETPEIREVAGQHGLELVLLTTPTTPKERMTAIAQNSQGFVYLVSITGVTGAKDDVSGRVEGLVQTLHEVTDKPVAVGFGVSKPEHVKKIVAWGAEGVIVGSALVRALGEAATPDEGVQAMRTLARSLKAAISK